jgi:hypothetical protein
MYVGYSLIYNVTPKKPIQILWNVSRNLWHTPSFCAVWYVRDFSPASRWGLLGSRSSQRLKP